MMLSYIEDFYYGRLFCGLPCESLGDGPLGADDSFTDKVAAAASIFSNDRQHCNVYLPIKYIIET